MVNGLWTSDHDTQMRLWTSQSRFSYPKLSGNSVHKNKKVHRTKNKELCAQEQLNTLFSLPVHPKSVKWSWGQGSVQTIQILLWLDKSRHSRQFWASNFVSTVWQRHTYGYDGVQKPLVREWKYRWQITSNIVNY